jgi:hypothetical protein
VDVMKIVLVIGYGEIVELELMDADIALLNYIVF